MQARQAGRLPPRSASGSAWEGVRQSLSPGAEASAAGRETGTFSPPRPPPPLGEGCAGAHLHPCCSGTLSLSLGPAGVQPPPSNAREGSDRLHHQVGGGTGLCVAVTPTRGTHAKG